MDKLPKDCSARRIGAKARKLVHYKLSTEHWEYHEETGCDFGVDCIIELVENDMWINKKIQGQIKGSIKPKLLKTTNSYSVEIEIKTVRYGLSSSIPYVIFFVDVNKEEVYYLPLQDYFIANANLFDRLEKNSETISVRIPIDNVVNEEDFELRQIAKSVYVEGPTKKLHKVE